MNNQTSPATPGLVKPVEQPAGGGTPETTVGDKTSPDVPRRDRFRFVLDETRKDMTRMNDQQQDHETKTTISTLYAEGRIIRGAWSRTDAQGRELLCLYTALVGDKNARPNSCPASLAPAWVAQLMPWWDDAGTEEHWPDVVRRVVAFAPRLGELTGETSTRLDFECRAIALRECLPVAGTSRDIVERVLALCERRAAGDAPSNEEWAAARARGRGRWGADGAEWAADVTARAAARQAAEATVRAAARQAAEAQGASWARMAGESAARAARAARAAAEEAAWAARAAADRIIDAQLTAIERALTRPA